MTEDQKAIVEWLKKHLDISFYRVNNEYVADLRVEGETVAVSYLRDLQLKGE